MPIPFILGGAAALAGGYGVKKGLDAKEDMDKAKRTNERARELAASTERRIDKQQFARLGQDKNFNLGGLSE